ncbi:spermidine/putrescine import ATP-binding protein PotA 1 [Gemmobacter aquaticus]|uniref:Spermidine/putrescine import ATP-binding protein PotA n=1 Tax=Gemmobacter aquaticus TaxID=490185 RepID=A0A917YIC8_9RHOB|nr:ABC transporter ATP-binding protein [Gemmobacter aquaticus]GGO30147.1 spermidine/putrescine import ATP-binding protein PotA 1 [Gemmobacter aquaticus]
MTDAVEIRNAVKRYGNVTALHGVSLTIRDNEFFTLLGPSGCGKTTLLRMIAGFEDVTEGEIRLFGQNIANLEPNHRPVNTVFQHYALFPHMSVIDNVAFGLKMQKVAQDARRKRAAEMLEMVHLSAFADRLPAQLSGGQQQRVALARALAPSPKVLLLDEPLSALDLKLRQAMRVELKQLQEDTGITFIFVTHDQEEALTMSDRIAVMSAGHVQQIGTAQEIYEAPVNRFVADFIGETNLLPVEVLSVRDGRAEVTLPGGHRLQVAAAGQGIGKHHLSIRPERMALTEAGDLQAVVDRVVYLGTDRQVIARLEDGTPLHLRLQNSDRVAVPAPGKRVGLAVEAGAARLLAD